MSSATHFHLPLLHSKLTPPLSARTYVPRARLINWLESSQNSRLIVLRAPAGFGKTTLMVQLHSHLRQRGANAPWLTLDEADNDPSRFLMYLSAAIQKSIPDFDMTSPQPGLFGNAPTGALLYLLDRISTLTIPLTIFLDDFGVIRSPEAVDIARQFVHHLPPKTRVVLAVRHVPELGLGRIRAQGELVEIDLEGLRFSHEETEQFIRQTQGLDLDEREVDYLYRTTEGWVAGLQLTTLSSIWREYRRNYTQTDIGAFDKISEYLAEDVLSRQPPEVQSFLTETSILNRLTGPLCDAITGRNDGYEMLAYLEKENLFLVPMDEERRWYRYHSLFARFLRDRFERGGHSRFRELHRAACDWYSGIGEVHEAAEHALLAGDAEYAAEQMERCAFDLVKVGHTSTVTEWGERLPSAVLDKYPVLKLGYIYALILRHQHGKALKLIDELNVSMQKTQFEVNFLHDLRIGHALALFCQDQIKELDQLVAEELPSWKSSSFDTHPSFLPALLHMAGILKLTVHRYDEALAYIWEAAHLLGQTRGLIWLYNKYIEGRIYLAQGRLKDVIALTRASLAEAGSDPSRYTPGGMALVMLQAEALYEKNELATAENMIRGYRAMLPAGVTVDEMIVGFRLLSRISVAHGDFEEARRYINEMERIGIQNGMPRASATARQERIRIAIERGELEQALQIARDPTYQSLWLPYEGHCMMGNDPETPDVTRIRLLLAQEQHTEALELLKTQLRKAEISQRFRQILLLQILLAKTYEACGERRQASRVLMESLLFGGKEGFIRAFIEEGKSITNLVRDIHKVAMQQGDVEDRDTPPIAYLEQILQAPKARVASSPELHPEQASSPTDDLTQREIKVLEKVALGLSNDELADQLCISVHTVRFHLRNIHSKLGVNNRTQAVAYARRFGLIR